MEHELFQSKLKPSVDGALVSDMIRSSSSGLNSHRTAAMELILERSIQERRERMFAKAKNNLRPDPTPQPKRTSEVPNISIPKCNPLPLPLFLQPPSQLPNDTTGTATSLVSASAKYEASQDSSALSKPHKKIKKVARREELPADAKTNPSPSVDFVELECQGCHLKQLRSHLRSGVFCNPCSWPRSRMKCVGCGTIRISDVDACTSCHKSSSFREEMCITARALPVSLFFASASRP
jgi:hypothetical protein